MFSPIFQHLGKLAIFSTIFDIQIKRVKALFFSITKNTEDLIYFRSIPIEEEC